MARKYQLRERAARQAETRQRIVEAAVALHQAKGIAATTIRDVAERAAVGRVTIYRHFKDEMALARACSGHYYARHPLPDIDAWKDIGDPRERLKTGLGEAYAYHRTTRAIMIRIMADARDHPVMAPYHAHWRRAAAVLTDAWPASGRVRKIRLAAIALALSFDTWRLLAVEHGLSDEEAAEAMMRLACDWA